ncbi:MAG: hypothetical protein ACK55I_35885, partial [bacterium]
MLLGLLVVGMKIDLVRCGRQLPPRLLVRPPLPHEAALPDLPGQRSKDTPHQQQDDGEGRPSTGRRRRRWNREGCIHPWILPW